MVKFRAISISTRFIRKKHCDWLPIEYCREFRSTSISRFSKRKGEETYHVASSVWNPNVNGSLCVYKLFLQPIRGSSRFRSHITNSFECQNEWITHSLERAISFFYVPADRDTRQNSVAREEQQEVERLPFDEVKTLVETLFALFVYLHRRALRADRLIHRDTFDRQKCQCTQEVVLFRYARGNRKQATTLLQNGKQRKQQRG